jgi:AbiV family abortive infection protein
MKLSKENLVEIIKKSIVNSRAFFDDALFLKQFNRLERAYTLFQLSTEESGKVMLAFGFLFFEDFEDEKKQKTFLRDFRDHQRKTTKAMNFDGMIADGVNDLKSRYTLHAFFYKRYSLVPWLIKDGECRS